METSERVQQRIALARPSEARTHGIHFTDTLGALGELYGEEVTRQARECVPVSIEPLPYGCPVADLLALSHAGALAAGQRLGVPYADAMERLGAHAWRGYAQSPLGRALWQFSVREPHDILHRSVVSARAAVNYGTRRYEPLGPTEALLVFRGDYMGSTWIRGMYLEGLQQFLQRPVSVRVEEEREPGMDFHLRLSW